MTVSIRITEEEKQLATSYARMHSESLSAAFKRALFDQIEEEYDVKAADAAYQEYAQSGYKSRPVEELFREEGV